MLLCSHSICTLRSSGVSFNSYFPSKFCTALSFHESTFTLGHISLLSFFPICILTLMQTLASWPCQEPKKVRKYLKRKEKKSKFLNSVKFKIYPKLNVEPKNPSPLIMPHEIFSLTPLPLLKQDQNLTYISLFEVSGFTNCSIYLVF